MTDRIEKEKKFHNERFAEDSRKHLDKYYTISNNVRELFFNKLKKDVAGQKVLEYGCGEGSYAFELALLGADVYGIDISDVAIEKANKLAIENRMDNKVHFEVMNAEELKYPNSYFEKICGNAILHHLDLDKALLELNRVLDKKGSALFIEPLGHNPIINFYRLLTKNLRTEDEHPLKENEFKLFNKYFDSVEINFFNLTTLMAIPFRNYKIFNKLLSFFNRVDSLLFRFSFFQKKIE